MCEAGSQRFLVSEYVSRSVASLNAKKVRPIAAVAALTTQVPLVWRQRMNMGLEFSAALAFTHSMGVVHGALTSKVVLVDHCGRIRGLPHLTPDLTNRESDTAAI